MHATYCLSYVALDCGCASPPYQGSDPAWRKDGNTSSRPDALAAMYPICKPLCDSALPACCRGLVYLALIARSAATKTIAGGAPGSAYCRSLFDRKIELEMVAHKACRQRPWRKWADARGLLQRVMSVLG